jgi:hypothetical protein
MYSPRPSTPVEAIMTKLLTSLALLAFSSISAFAGESGKITGHAVITVHPVATLDVADSPDHHIYISTYEGTVASDGLLNNARYEVAEVFDTAGLIRGGYKTFTLQDGSKIFAKYEVTEPGETAAKGRFEILSGTQKCQGITGKGNFEGKWTSETTFEDTLTGEYSIP